MVRMTYLLANRLEGSGFVKGASEVRMHTGDCRSRPLSSTCRLSFTVKTHKPDGEICVRMIHTSVGHLLKALGCVVNRILDPIIREQRHIAWSSEDVQNLVRETCISSSTILLKFDVEEFYMSGMHSDLASTASSVVEPKPLSEWLGDCIAVCGSHGREDDL